MTTHMSRDREQPLREQIYGTLKGEILSGELAPGEAIGEEALAQRYGTSRTPVREVLTSLGRDGLVQYYPHRGYYVTDFKLDDVLDVFQIRMMVEPQAAALAAARATPDDIEYLDALAREIASSDEPGEVNLRLHRYVAELTTNQLLAELVEQLNEKIWLFGRDYLAPLNPTNTDLAHFQIIEALRKGDPEEARKAMQRHLEQTQLRVSRHVR